MTDLEKVINHLKDCHDETKHENMWCFVRKDIIEDTLELLHEELPRILTLDEAYKAEIVWYESRCECDCDYGRVYKSDRTLASHLSIVNRVYGCSAFEDNRDYGKAWRCWNRKPDDKQRKKTEWDG